jgi:hypothetical protein
MGAKDSASCLLFCRGRRGFCGFFNWQDGVAPSRLSSIYERRSGCARGVTVGCQGGEWGRAWGGSPGARCACKERKPRLLGGACEGGPRRRVACTARGGGVGGAPEGRRRTRGGGGAGGRTNPLHVRSVGTGPGSRLVLPSSAACGKFPIALRRTSTYTPHGMRNGWNTLDDGDWRLLHWNCRT